jgi:sugar phosphate isomerase/epimerase
MIKISRRDFIRSAALGAAVPLASRRMFSSTDSASGAAAREPLFSLGLASYTLREFNLDQTIEMTRRVGLEKIVLKSMHLPLESPEEAILAASAKVRASGLDLYGCGVVYMANQAEVDQAFKYAKTAGMRLIIGVPNHELLEYVNRKVADSGIGLAIHNHGPEDKLYPTPASVYEKIGGLDQRVGLCIDVGHTVRSGVDPAEAARRFADRLLDVHIKDVTAATREGTTVEMGRGVIDIPGFIRTLIDLKYGGVLAFEYEKDGKDPLPGLAESVGYLRGVLRTLA